MKNYSIAWRNIWRNKKRTLITIAAVFLAVFLSTFMSSMQVGTYSKMIDNVVKFYSGYIQIIDSNYWETKSINDVYEADDALVSTIKNNSNITSFLPRLESFTLLSSGEHTKGAALIGIDPIRENELTSLKQWVKKGKYLNLGDDGIIIAKNIAKTLKVDIGDTLVLLGQGYHGATAAGLFPLRGILEFPSPDLNNYGSYVDITRAQEFFSCPNMVTSTVIMVENYEDVKLTQNQLNKSLSDQYLVKTWDEIQPELVQMIEGDKAGGILMKAVLYIVIGFGILGTIIMMVSERRRESGIIIAVGMQKIKLMSIMFFETFYIGFAGVLSGFLFSLPMMAYFVKHPIPLPAEVAETYEKFGIEPYMFFSLHQSVFTNQILIVFAITLLVSIYPVLSIASLKVTSAIRG